jgi:uncharacterized membrane protein YdjX (TVP38/TMEM64 family)
MKKKNGVKYAAIGSVVLALLALNHFVFKVSPLSLRDWVLSFGILAPFLYILLNLVRPLTLFPISVLSLAGGLAFGALLGTVYTVLSATAGAVISYFFAKHFRGHRLKKKRRTSARIELWQEKLRANGFYYILVLRIIPIINFDLVSYLAGASSLRLRSYISATLLGVLPGTLAYNLLGNSFVKGDGTMNAIAASGVLLLICLPLLLKNKPFIANPFENQKEDKA